MNSNIKIRFSSGLYIMASLIFIFLQNIVLCQTTDTYTNLSTYMAPLGFITGVDGQKGDISVTANNSSGTSYTQTLFPTSGKALDHSNYDCSSCHITHDAPGAALTSIAGNALLCQSCHAPAEAASSMPLINADKAIPGTSGTSHAWDVLAINATYETNTPTDTEMAARITSNNIICSVCHDQHNAVTSYLRISNSGDAMCKDCHSARDIGLYSTDNVNHKGSHPVGVTYNGADSRFNASPTNTQVVSGNVECSSCHYVHDVDGSISETTPKGYLLRNANDNTLCTDCHTYGTHNAMNCLDCHQTHNTNKSNIYMIKNTISTPSSGDKTVVFTTETGTNSFADGNATYDGVCEVCHTTNSKTYHYNTAAGDHTHEAGSDCTGCHTHDDSFTAPNCHGCHTNDYPNNEWPLNDGTYTEGAHEKHAIVYVCSTCHYLRGSGGTNEGSHPDDATPDVVFDPAGLAKNNGTADPSWNGSTCGNIYCHSDASSVATPNYTTTPVWNSGSITTCTPCHGVDISSSVSPGTAAHTKHVSTPYSYACSTCHNGLDNTSAGHADGTKDLVFSGTANLYTTASYTSATKTCSNVYCHSDGLESGATYASPTWDGSAIACAGCHGVDVSTIAPATGAHAKHTGTPYSYACSNCHSGLDGTHTIHADGTKDVVFNPSGLATRNGDDGNTPAWNGTTCSTVYCHSDGISAQSTSGTGGWNLGTYTIPSLPNFVTTPLWTTGNIACGDCHAANAAGTVYPATGEHAKSQHKTGCYWCHSTDNAYTYPGGTYGSAETHITGDVFFDARSYSVGGTIIDESDDSFEEGHCGSSGGGGKTCWW